MSIDQQAVTMEAVAEKAGVSRSTVSRALRDHPAIPAATRQRIKEVAESLGYRPNPFVAVLMSQLKQVKRSEMTSTIALISAFPIEVGWKQRPSVTRMVEGAFLQAQKLGHHLETFCLAEPGMTPERLSRILHTRGIRGVIILPTPKSGANLSLDWRLFSSVAFGYSLASPQLHRVCNHLSHTVAKALDNVIRLGYGRIGCAMQADTDERVDHSWRSGFLLYRDMFPQIEFLPMLLTRDWAPRAFATWFHEHAPEVVVTDDLQVQQWLQDLHLSVPRDVGLALLDCSKSHCACAGIDQHHEIMGATAVDVVVEQLWRNETGIPSHPKSVMIEGSWVDGITLTQKRTAGTVRRAVARKPRPALKARQVRTR